ncbi:MAG TPA: hypothetical protein VNM67_14690 [Thermoanaerobaculia bacterium]|nr:hypothetical protein [Thermoanaerobaculia bacterium]
MATPHSVDEILAKLQEQVDFHAEQENLFAAQEEHYREKRSVHTAALEEARRKLEAFRTAAAEALDLAERNAVPPKHQVRDYKDEDLGSASRPKVGRMVTLLLKEKGPDERFGAQQLYREVNQRFRDHLKRAVDPTQMSVVLRRLERRGIIHQVRPGRPYKEALYVRERPA